MGKAVAETAFDGGPENASRFDVTGCQFVVVHDGDIERFATLSWQRRPSLSRAGDKWWRNLPGGNVSSSAWAYRLSVNCQGSM